MTVWVVERKGEVRSTWRAAAGLETVERLEPPPQPDGDGSSRRVPSRGFNRVHVRDALI